MQHFFKCCYPPFYGFWFYSSFVVLYIAVVVVVSPFMRCTSFNYPSVVIVVVVVWLIFCHVWQVVYVSVVNMARFN